MSVPVASARATERAGESSILAPDVGKEAIEVSSGHGGPRRTGAGPSWMEARKLSVGSNKPVWGGHGHCGCTVRRCLVTRQMPRYALPSPSLTGHCNARRTYPPGASSTQPSICRNPCPLSPQLWAPLFSHISRPAGMLTRLSCRRRTGWW